jgi:signal transduction histidine kinase
VPLKTVRFDELLLQAHEEVQRRHPTCRIDLEFSEPAPGREGAPFNVMGNEALLLSAVLNVMENACKFSKDSHQPVTAMLTSLRDGVKLEVSDHGMGMSEADRQQVFVPFFRAETVRDVPGHGIGLPLTAKIMSLHNGAVQVESQLGEGTKVSLQIPAERL